MGRATLRSAPDAFIRRVAAWVVRVHSLARDPSAPHVPTKGNEMDITTQPLTDEHLDDAIRFLRSANPFAEHTWGWETGRFLDWRWGGNILRDQAEPGFFARNGTVIVRNNDIAALVIAESGAEDHCILTATDDAELFDAALAWLLEETRRAAVDLLSVG